MPVSHPATRRMAWGVMDQAVSSISNMVVLVLVARSVAPADFGAFAIAVEVYLVIVFVGRGMSSDPLVTAHAADAPEALTRAARAGATVVVAVGAVSALVVALVGVITEGVLGRSLVVLAVLLPGLLLQDYVRSVFIVRQRPVGAFVIDALWLLFEVPVLLVAIEAGHGSVPLLAWWAVCGVVSGLAGLLWARLLPSGIRQAVAYLVRHGRLWPYFVLENLVFRATILVVMVGLTLTAGLAGVAGLRAATAIFAPVTVLGRGVVVVAVPELARQAGEPATVRRGVRRLTVLLAPMPLLLAAVLLAAPEGVGEALFGETWLLALPLIALTAVSSASAMYAIAIAVGLRALQAARAGLTARVTVAVLALVAALVGGWQGGEYGAALALALSSPFQVAVWWWQLRAALTNAARGGGAAGTGQHALRTINPAAATAAPEKGKP